MTQTVDMSKEQIKEIELNEILFCHIYYSAVKGYDYNSITQV